MAQQTAVDWLRELYDSRPAYEEFILEDEWEQAKEMEKEHIINSSRISYLAGQEYHALNGLSKQFAEEYYNKTYKK